PDGGEVTIKAQIIDCAVSIGRRETDPHHPVIMEPSGGSAGATENVSPCLKIAVMDSGIGIQKGHLNRIFDRFDQVESSASRKFQGSGLGLSLAKSFVELHGGKIWAESDGQGKGSTFAFIIPTRLEEAVTIHPPTAADTEPLQKGGIS
ncbi:MAG: ATP-binding protein, partial [Desulfobacterales bacterium]|nr:ATP-binding protein [Desulfobacterales bacterium]